MTTRTRLILMPAVVLMVTACGLFGDPTLGELVSFDALQNFEQAAGAPERAAELSADQQPEDAVGDLGDGEITDLPPLEDGLRRFAFVVSGCKHDSAQLVIEDGLLTAQLLEDGSTEQQTDCGGLAWFLAVFDVPAEDLPEPVRLP